MLKKILSICIIQILLIICFVLAVILFMVLASTKVEAKTITIDNPIQMRNLNKNYESGTFKLETDLDLAKDLSSDEVGTCLLTNGNFVIDLNGHTLQSTDKSQTVIDIRGATVILKDSKAKTASRSRPSIRSYGLGAVQITSGKLTIKSGYYCGASDGTNNPVGLHVGGGTCTVNGGVFEGDHVGASVMGGNMRINGGTFRTSYMFALMEMGGGNIKITNGTFTNTKAGSFNPTFALGALNTSGSNYNFGKWLADGASFNPTIMTYYWNGTSTDTSAYPTKMVGTQYVQTPYTYPYAVAYTGNSGYEAVTIKVIPKEKESQTITAKSFSKIYGAKPFFLGAKTLDNSKLTYNSSNKKVVTVSSKGKVTIKGCGKVTVTIKAAETSTLKSKTKKVTITIKPGKLKITGYKGKKVTFKKQPNVSGYQAIISKTGSKMKRNLKLGRKAKTVDLSGYSSGNYRLKIRAYKIISKKKVYGAWGSCQLTKK